MAGFKFEPDRARLTYVFWNLVEIVVKELSSFGKDDAMDPCHASMGTAFARIVALDKKWSAWVRKIPNINLLASVYQPAQVEEMVAELEQLVEIDPEWPPAGDSAVM